MNMEDYLSFVYFGDNIDFADRGLRKDITGDSASEHSPVFTVMMAVYNDTSLLNSAINSCLRQDFSSWELLILDNSDQSDAPWEMIQNAVNYDARIRAYRSEKNVGWAKGSAVLLEHARGEYVTFLSADDCLDPSAFGRLYEVIQRESPDVIFVGNMFVNFKGKDDIEFSGAVLPEYRLYCGDKRSESLVEIMQKFYYNSMFHYEKRQFLIENEMDFFEPYYTDCATMTYAIGRADRIVVLDMIVYFLTLNTSQSGGHYSPSAYDYIFLSQWRSVKTLFMSEGYTNQENVYYVATRIFDYFAVSIGPLCAGKWWDKYMNAVESSLAGILRELEEILETREVGELFLLMKKDGFKKLIKNMANIKIFPIAQIEQAVQDSWLYSLFMIVLWRRKLSDKEKMDYLCDFLLREENRWSVGIYALDELVEGCPEEELDAYRDRIQKIHEKFDRGIQELNNPWLIKVLDV